MRAEKHEFLEAHQVGRGDLVDGTDLFQSRLDVLGSEVPCCLSGEHLPDLGLWMPQELGALGPG